MGGRSRIANGVCLFWILAAGIVGLGLRPAGADGLIFNIPPDGSWARYDFQAVGEVGKLREKPQAINAKGSLTLRSVGQVIRGDGQASRWLEMKFAPAPDESHIVKILVPEAYLKPGQDPLAHVTRMFYKGFNREPERIESAWRRQLELDRFRRLFPPPLKEAQRQTTQTLQTPVGAFACAPLTGTVDYESKMRGDSWQGRYRICLADKAPFGVVSLEVWAAGLETISDTEKVILKVKETLTLAEVGNSAKSELPDNF